MKKTCRRFDPLADEEFRKRCCVTEFAYCLTWGNGESPSEFNLSSNVLRIFGKFVRTLKVYKLNEQQWLDISESCTHLDKLTVFNCNLKFFTHNPLKHPEFKSLELIECSGQEENVMRIIQCCQKLTLVYSPIPYRNFPRLKDVRLHYNILGSNLLIEFIRLNPQIENISVGICLADAFEEIVERCPNIENLLSFAILHKFDCSEKPLTLWSRLNKLKHLNLACTNDMRCTFSTTINSLVEQNSLESLVLSGWNSHRLIYSCEALSKLSNLKILIFINFCISERFLQLIMSEMKLTNLQIIDCDEVNYKNIVNAIKYSRTIETINYEAAKSEKPLNDTYFLQLVKARKVSGAGFLLEFALDDAKYDRMNVSYQVIVANANIIKLKKVPKYGEIFGLHWLDKRSPLFRNEPYNN